MENIKYSSAQEKALYEALKRYGYIFPETEDELKHFEESISKMKLNFPDKFNDPLKILEVGKIEKIEGYITFSDEEIEENLAQAAREGSEIPDEVLKQMEIDRQKAEKAKSDDDGVE